MKGLNYPSGKDDLEKFGKIIQQLHLMLYIKKIKTHPTYVSEHEILNHDNIIILLIIPNEEGWHYHAVKILSLLLREKR